MRLCAQCSAEHTEWLDARGPFHRSIRIQQIGQGNHNVPSWVGTNETIKQQLRLIREHCVAKHSLKVRRQP